MPKENVSTRTPTSLAMKKWPNSWMKTRMPKTMSEGQDRAEDRSHVNAFVRMI